MPDNFFIRLREYYLKVISVMKGEADSASIFPNPTDIGQSREKVYSEFLKLHAPSKCNVFLGGFLFDHISGEESKQIDIIVTTDTTPRFDFHNQDGSGKSFAPVEGTLCVVSNKSNLNKEELEDALDGIASIPPTKSLEKRISHGMAISNYDNWPIKVIFSISGLNSDTINTHLINYYKNHPEIPSTRRPDLIHIIDKYILIRAVPGVLKNNSSQKLDENDYVLFTEDSDIQAIVFVLSKLQEYAMASNYILYSYNNILQEVRKDHS